MDLYGHKSIEISFKDMHTCLASLNHEKKTVISLAPNSFSMKSFDYPN